MILDISKVSNIADFFVILSGNSARQVKAISDHIVQELKKRGSKVWHIEGYRSASWILLDCGDVVAHIFQSRTRNFYALEKLWAGAPQLKI